MVDELNQEVKSKKRPLLLWGWLIDKIAPKKKQGSVSNAKSDEKPEEEVKTVLNRRENDIEQSKEKGASSVLKGASFAVVTTNDPKSYSPIPQNRGKAS